MNLFRGRAAADGDGFYDTGIPADQITVGELHVVSVAGRTALLTRIDGKIRAFSNVCPHAAADLGKGRLFDGQIKCPDHGYTFDIRTGRATWPPDEVCRLFRFTTREKKGVVQVSLERPGA